MWRAFFLAIGATLCVLGVESLVIDHAVLSADSGLVQKSDQSVPVYDDYGFEIDRKPVGSSPRIIAPPEWSPWSMLSAGTVILLYAAAYKVRGE